MSNEELMLTVLRAVGKKLITEEVYDETVKEIFTELKNKAAKVHRHTADDVDDSATKRIPTIVKQTEWDKKVSEEQLNAAVNTFASGLEWKGVFPTLDELKAKITQPKEGYFAIITQDPAYQNKNTIVIYEAEQVNDWQTITSILLPGLATQEQDGLMSKGDKKKLDGLQNYTLPVANANTLGGVKAKTGGNVTISSDGTIDVASEKIVSATEKQKWNQASTDATQALAKATEVDTKITYVTVEEAKTIINKYKA